MRIDFQQEPKGERERTQPRNSGEVGDISSDRLLRFLATRRWFAAKGREPESAHILDAVPVGGGWIARVEVKLRDGVERYQLTLRGQESGVGSQGGLEEGLEDGEFLRAFARAITDGIALEGPGARWAVDWVSGVPDELPEPRLAGAEQSNTSLIFGDRAILKLYRRLEPGEHPDAEIARFLTTRARFPHTPELLATARFETSGGAEVAAMLQRFLPGARDAWHVALERGREAFRIDASARIPFAAEAETLGDITRAMHVALASDDTDPAFAPELATAADAERWAKAVRAASDRALSLLGRSLSSGALSERSGADAKKVLHRGEGMNVLIEGSLEEIGDDLGARIRHHGDFHLGQVIQPGETSASSAFLVIDFEGEPARPLEERRAKQSALRDVAGMLRSFSYAAATCAEAARAELGEDDARRRAERWERELRDAFLRGYLPEGHEHPAFLPATRARLDVLLELFEAEKLFYELAYELNNRPSWVWIPLRGVIAMMRAGGV